MTLTKLVYYNFPLLPGNTAGIPFQALGLNSVPLCILFFDNK